MLRNVMQGMLDIAYLLPAPSYLQTSLACIDTLLPTNEQFPLSCALALRLVNGLDGLSSLNMMLPSVCSSSFACDYAARFHLHTSMI